MSNGHISLRPCATCCSTVLTFSETPTKSGTRPCIEVVFGSTPLLILLFRQRRNRLATNFLTPQRGLMQRSPQSKQKPVQSVQWLVGVDLFLSRTRSILRLLQAKPGRASKFSSSQPQFRLVPNLMTSSTGRGRACFQIREITSSLSSSLETA